MNDKDDGIFENIKLFTQGTTSTRIGKLLNFAVSQMGEKECYLEVGVFTGSTLCQAAYVNERFCVGIDNYLPDEIKQITGMPSDFIRDRCLFNINCLGRGRIKLIEKDFRDVSVEEISLPVAVSFIDGKHDYAGVMDNLKWLEPKLADHAILVFDDINYIEVSLAIEDWMSSHADHYDMLAYIKPFYGDSADDSNLCSVRDRFINNGVCVIRYHKDNSNSFTWDIQKMGMTREQLTKGEKPC